MSTNQIPDLHKYFQDAYKRHKNTGERLGQAMFNHLFEIRPKLANAVRGTDNDPFYSASTYEHRLMTNFRCFISENWYSSEYIDE